VKRLALLRVATLRFEALATLGWDGIGARAGAVLQAARAVERMASEISDLLFGVAGPPDDDAQRSQARFALLRVRRDVHAGRRPRTADVGEAASLLDGAIRSRLAAYEESLEALAAAERAFDAAWEHATTTARCGLLAIVGSPLVEHGLYLGSRSLVPKVRRLARRHPQAWTHEDRHTASKAAAYVARFAAKTSPNGVFCAVAPAWIQGARATVRGEGGVARTDVLLSVAEARKVSACLAADPIARAATIPRPNPTLREIEGAWDWWQPASPRHPTDEEVHARTKDHPVLRAFVAETTGGIHDPEALVRAVAARTGMAEGELTGFLERLVERGILIAEIEVPWSSRRRLRDLAAAAHGCGAPWAATLDRIEDAVDAVGTLPFAARPPAMDAIARDMETLPRTRPYRADELFRVDSASAFDVTLPERVLDDLRTALSFFTAFLATLYPEEAQHHRLVERFLRDHPADADVPLLDLYGSLAEPEANGGTPLMEFPEPPAEAGRARRVFEELLRRAAEAGAGDEVELSLDPGRDEPRWAAGVLFQVAARSPEDIDAGRYRIALNAVFNGVGLALSRFAHLLQDGRGEGAVVDELRRAWSCLERPGAVLAELTFNHEARTANAGLRPVLFRREIELPGERSSPGVENFPLSDLVLRYDSAADRLVVRSRAKGVEVIPVVSSGVSPSGIVAALIHVGRQGLQSVGYLPGFHAENVVRWPRFTCGRVVLFRARWVFRGGAFPLPARDGAPLRDSAFFLEVARWREAHGLPRHVFVHTSSATKPFYVDLESPVLVDLLRRAVTRIAEDSVSLVVTEMLPGPEELWVRDAAGAYAAEFLVQMEGPTPAVSSS